MRTVAVRVSRSATSTATRRPSAPRGLHTDLRQQAPPSADDAPVPPAPSFSRVPNAPSVSAAQLAHFGSVRRAWRPLLERLSGVPRLQQLVLETASFFTTPSEIDFHLPRTFDSKYQIAELLGEGAFGRVHRVVSTDPRTDLDLAVKIIPKLRVVNLADYQALQQEGRMMVLLGGTLNVVHFFGAYEDDENVYLVMEHCVGGDAFARLTSTTSHGPPSEPRVAMYMADVFHVVWQCHLLRILHGDLKLENFLFADTKELSPLKLTDFGGASFLNDGERLYEVRGTPLYTAPEVLKRTDGYSFPSDMWSCGVILYRVLSGRFPFEGPLLDEKIIMGKLDLESPPWHQISPQAKDLVRRLLTHDVDARLTAKEALQHPWIARPTTNVATSRARVLDGTLVQRLQLYRSLNSFQQAVFTEIARLLPLETKEEIVVLFSELSHNGSSRVGIAELTEYIATSGYHLTQGEVKSFLSSLDVDGDGFVALDELCAALLDWSTLQRESPARWEGIVTRVFESLDSDGDGHLTLDDLARLAPFAGGTTNHHSFRGDMKRCFQHGDLDGDGSIDRREFIAMLHMQLRAYEHYAQRLH